MVFITWQKSESHAPSHDMPFDTRTARGVTRNDWLASTYASSSQLVILIGGHLDFHLHGFQ